MFCCGPPPPPPPPPPSLLVGVSPSPSRVPQNCCPVASSWFSCSDRPPALTGPTSTCVLSPLPVSRGQRRWGRGRSSLSLGTRVHPVAPVGSHCHRFPSRCGVCDAGSGFGADFVISALLLRVCVCVFAHTPCSPLLMWPTSLHACRSFVCPHRCVAPPQTPPSPECVSVLIEAFSC